MAFGRKYPFRGKIILDSNSIIPHISDDIYSDSNITYTYDVI
jgi:hypothetical protein